MTDAAAVVLCALALLGRSPETMPRTELVELVLVERMMEGTSPIEGYVVRGSGTITVVTSSAAFRAARCGKPRSLVKLASSSRTRSGMCAVEATSAAPTRRSLQCSSDLALVRILRCIRACAIRCTTCCRRNDTPRRSARPDCDGISARGCASTARRTIASHSRRSPDCAQEPDSDPGEVGWEKFPTRPPSGGNRHSEITRYA